jgi:hypothetical protein
MMIFYIKIFLPVLIYVISNLFFVTFSQEIKNERFISIGENIFDKGIFQYTAEHQCRYDVAMVSKKPNNAKKINTDGLRFDDDIKMLTKNILIDSLIPDKEFIEKNKICYSVSADPKKNLPFPWQDGHDIIYLSYSVDDLTILLAFIGSNSFATTYLFIAKSNQDKTEKYDIKFLSKIINKDTLKLVRFISENENDIKLYGRNSEMQPLPPRVIPAYHNQQSICLVMPHKFEGDIVSTDYPLNELFANRKEWKKIDNEEKRRINIVKSLIADREKKCKTLVKTPQRRAELIELAVSNEGETEFRETLFSFHDFQQLPKKAISDYYSNLAMSDEINFSKIPSFGQSKELPISPEEIKSIRKLLKSEDLTKRFWGVYLIKNTNCKSFVPDLLSVCLDKRYEKSKNSCAVFIKGKPEIIEYNYGVIMLIGKLGGTRTFQALKSMFKSNDTPDDFKPDIKQAMEHIKNNLIERERQKQNWLNLRREVREGKLVVIDGIIDIDKPDHEPVSQDGYRNWETVDGLFKTAAKFIGLKDIEKRVGQVADKDVQLLRNDKKIVAIELSALRKIDQEYIRQLLEPEREWTTIDSNLKIKAKIIGKFDQ